MNRLNGSGQLFQTLEKCEGVRKKLGHGTLMQNMSIMCCLNLSFSEVITSDENWDIVTDFFQGKFVLNSLGGNNNKGGNANYASEMHMTSGFILRRGYC